MDLLGKVKGTFQGIFPHLWPFQHHRSPYQVENFSIMGRESHNLTKMIKEAMYIMINHSTRTFGSTSWPIYGMRSCLTPQMSNSNRPFHITRDPHHKLGKGMQGGLKIVSTHHNVCMWSSTISLVPHHLAQPMVPFVVSINVFNRPDEAMLFSWWKLVITWKLFCSEPWKTILLINWHNTISQPPTKHQTSTLDKMHNGWQPC